MLSPNLEQTLHRALALASERRHDYATLEHLLLALTDDQDAVAVMRACPMSMSICLALLRDRGIPVHVEETRAAVELYNKLAEEARVGGLFHSTC